MAHDNAAEYEDDLARRTAAELMTQDLRRGFRNKFDESLVNGRQSWPSRRSSFSSRLAGSVCFVGVAATNHEDGP